MLSNNNCAFSSIGDLQRLTSDRTYARDFAHAQVMPVTIQSCSQSL